jgi:WD40 repeat protein
VLRGEWVGVRLYDDESKTFQAILKHDNIRLEEFAFSSCGRRIATFHRQLIQLWRNDIDMEWSLVATVEGILVHTTKIAWRPNTTEFVSTCRDGSIRTWKAVEDESSKVSIQLVWRYGSATLTTPGVTVVGAKGLSAVNQKLLEQGGAIF